MFFCVTCLKKIYYYKRQIILDNIAKKNVLLFVVFLFLYVYIKQSKKTISKDAKQCKIFDVD